MASIPQILTRDLRRCTDQMLISILRNYRVSKLNADLLRHGQALSSEINRINNDLCLLDDPDADARLLWFQETSALSGEIERLLDDWCLLRHTEAEAMEGWKTDQGTWSPKKLVSIPSTSQGNSPNSPKSVGRKTTMEFKPTDGSKAVVGMTRYNLLMTMKDRPGLYQDEELSLCHTYPLERKATVIRNRNGKRPHAADHCNDVVLPPLDAHVQETSKVDVTELSPIDVDDYGVDVPDLPSTDSSKRPRPESKHWHNFTKIYTKNPEVMYAACNYCNTMLKLKGGSSCGTGSLKHHNDSCRCKPKQEQLPGISSSMPIPSIALQAITE